MNAHTLYLISGPIRFVASDDDAKRLAQELQANNCELARLRAEVERLTNVFHQSGSMRVWAQLEEERDALRAEVESLTQQLKAGESFHAVAVQQRDAAWREVEALRSEVERLRADAEALRDPVARPLADWHEDMGPVLWWCMPVEEGPWVGQPTDSDWPGYHTHWTKCVGPSRAAQGDKT